MAVSALMDPPLRKSPLALGEAIFIADPTNHDHNADSLFYVLSEMFRVSQRRWFVRSSAFCISRFLGTETDHSLDERFRAASLRKRN